ncbi:MAG TPA: hypothetical protein VE915_04465 [Actinomycetota bacterium]|jgi:hypothetical protein|nr:hypothetical protein [Actinomycetota bacterium]
MQRRVVALALLLGLGSGACAGEETAPPSVLTGVITEIAASNDGEVTGFDLEAAGESYVILIDPGRDYGFDLNHLYEHETSGDPVRVRLRERDEALYALRIDDA